MESHLDLNDPRYRDAALAILRRHDNNEVEANIASAVRDFFILTGLANADEIVEENPPTNESRRAVDLTALDTFVEFKRRIGTASGFNPDPANVAQIDEYLELSKSAGKGVRTGILTDGKYWLLRWPDAGLVRTERPYGFVLDDPEQWVPLFEWLRDTALLSLDNIPADRTTIERILGPASPTYQRDIDTLTALYREATGYETVRVKRRLWEDLLRAALGEVAGTPAALDDLFVRHTYLSAVIGIAVQASFGGEIYRLSESDPGDLLQGRDFRNKTGLQGIVESDFFAWPTEVGGLPLLRTLARRVARFDWQRAPHDVAATLYETVIPPDERRQLGEYYTPDWLAKSIVRELVTDPLNQHVLDPACGSGTFVAEAVAHFLEAAAESSLDPKEVLELLRFSVSGIDVHPVAVHLARSAWVLAAQPAIEAAVRFGFAGNLTVPIYLGDSLQLRFRTGDMFAQHQITIQVDGDQSKELIFPVSLVDRAETFDALMGDIAEAIETGESALMALDDHGIADPTERQALESTIASMEELHSEGRNHIWAYYTRNLVRPVALSRSKVDVIVGNPPWLSYRNTASTLRTELERQSKDLYGIWVGGRHANHQDISTLFFARCIDLYLKDGAVLGMVLPHSALQTGQHAKWRTGSWHTKPSGRGRNRVPGRALSVDFSQNMSWDLEGLEPNTFFPVPASVVFAKRTGEDGTAVPLAGEAERWLGEPGENTDRNARTKIIDTSITSVSPYAHFARQGAVLVPRCLFLAEETENPTNVQVGQTVTLNPRRGTQDKEPWRSLNLDGITTQTVEVEHVYDVYLGETLVPYATLSPLKAVLPLRAADGHIPADNDGVGGISIGGLERRMRDRWRIVSRLWEQNKTAANKLNLLEQLDYYGKLSAQLEWQRDSGDRPVRVLYSGWGAPTAALLRDDGAVVDYKLFWVACRDHAEAYYLLAVINSDTLADAVNKYTTPNWAGNTRDLQKHLWKLPIPLFDPNDPLHTEIADVGRVAAQGAAELLDNLRQERDRVTVTIARRETRRWLRASQTGRDVEDAVGKLLAGA